jgi:hypothetical protein
MTNSTVLDSHFTAVINAIREGRLIPFLGAGANLCGRPKITWTPKDGYLPSGKELATHLANISSYKISHNDELLHVSQYVSTMEGTGPLYQRLHDVFDYDYRSNPLHACLASLSSKLQQKNYPSLLIVTTNYDDVLEQLFTATNEPYDLFTYIADDRTHSGKFRHKAPGAQHESIVTNPNEHQGLDLAKRSAIVKIHGTVSRNSKTADNDSYVITEDHYIDYLSQASQIPSDIMSRFQRGQFLFLGYGLRDWNLRVILRRIEREQNQTYRSWAIQSKPTPLESRFWATHDIEILDMDLHDYIPMLNMALQVL